MTSHDISKFADGLSARLASRSRHVAVLLGAGSSRACGLPDVVALKASVSAKLGDSHKALFDGVSGGLNLEEALSRIRRIAAVAEEAHISGMNAAEATELDRAVCAIIVSELSANPTDIEPILRFGAWAARTTYSRPLEIFTVNYDLLIERALERWGVPYFDGFVGTLDGTFRSDLVEAIPGDDETWIPSFFVRLWKLHGSANWKWLQSGDHSDVRRLGVPVGGDQMAAIYPSDAKYEESRRMPFVVLQDRFRRALNEPETVLLVSGYSWGDDHLNDVIFDATIRRPRSEVIAFCYAEIPEKLAATAALTPNLQVVSPLEGIIGGIRAPWEIPAGTIPSDIWFDGKVALGNFSSLTSYLARGSYSGPSLEALLAEMLVVESHAVD